MSQITALTDIANSKFLSRDQRLTYLNALKEIYRHLPGPDHRTISSPDVFFLAPGREGHILADQLGYLPNGRSATPQAKRMPWKEGLVVGIEDFPNLPTQTRRCVVIDGAIASGATLISIMDRIRVQVDHFEIYAAHSTLAGIFALMHFSKTAKIETAIFVGHVSGQLNEKFYAVLDDKRLVVGDLGDIIVPMCD